MALVAKDTDTPGGPAAQTAPAGAPAPTGPADMPLLKTIRSVEARKPVLRKTVYTAHGEYTGEWLDNLRHGKGRYIYSRVNAIYEGDWLRGVRSGYGTYDVKYPNTGEYIRAYVGFWKNNQKHGYGTYYFSKDEYYEGGWKFNRRSGRGKMRYANGDVYEGEWCNDKYSGQGTLISGKSRYEGFWKYGMRNGPGKVYYMDTGKIYKGFWVYDRDCWTPGETCWAEGPNTKNIPAPELKVPNPKKAIEEDQRGHLQKRKRTTL